jgi:D-alanyl-D-alanine carboxypeptidase
VNALGIPSDYGRTRGLRLQAEATQLVSIGTKPEGGDIQLTPAAASAWVGMRDAAAVAGIPLVAISGFRSIARQTGIIQAKISAGMTIESILVSIAAPGYSEHHTGRAIDIGVPGVEPLTEDFAETPAFRWLESNGARHGFTMSYPRGNMHGITYEPWHWCFKATD